MQEYHVVQSETIFENAAVRIIIDTIEHQGKQRRYFYMASPIEAVATVGLTAGGQIILTRQYRHPVGSVIYDLPAGRLNPGEYPVEGARREFEEETGFYPEKIQLLGYYNQFPGTLRAGTNLYFASDLRHTAQNLDEGEELEIVQMPVEQVLEIISEGAIIDGSLQLGMLLAKLKGLLPEKNSETKR